MTRAERAVQVCRDAGVQLGVVFQNRFRPAVQRLAALARVAHSGRSPMRVSICAGGGRSPTTMSPAAARMHVTVAAY